jgi:hypothetical protein
LVIIAPKLCFCSGSNALSAVYVMLSSSLLQMVCRNVLHIVHVVSLGCSCLISSSRDALCLILLLPFAIDGKPCT